MRLNVNVWMVALALALPAAAGAQQNPSIAGLVTDGTGSRAAGRDGRSQQPGADREEPAPS